MDIGNIEKKCVSWQNTAGRNTDIKTDNDLNEMKPIYITHMRTHLHTEIHTNSHTYMNCVHRCNNDIFTRNRNKFGNRFIASFFLTFSYYRSPVGRFDVTHFSKGIFKKGFSMHGEIIMFIHSFIYSLGHS